MARKKDLLNSEWFDKQVGNVFEDYRTKEDERRKVAQDWCMGDYESHHRLARERGLLPAAVITAALLEVDHPLLVENGLLRCRSLLGCSILILQAQLHQRIVHIPLGTAWVQPVDNSELSTGESVFERKNALVPKDG
jgi:hypothetical protein